MIFHFSLVEFMQNIKSAYEMNQTCEFFFLKMFNLKKYDDILLAILHYKHVNSYTRFLTIF